eukprot:3131419-Rhodomonas_salina.3
MIEDDWIRKLEELGLSREAQRTVLHEAALAAIRTVHCDALADVLSGSIRRPQGRRSRLRPPYMAAR